MPNSPCAEHRDAPAGNGNLNKRIRRVVTGRIRDYYAITTPGFESVCRHELIGLGVDCLDCSPDPGGVAFTGRFVDCQRANLYLRTATRILMRIDGFTATNPRQLHRQCAAIPWELFLPAGPLPEIKVSSRRSRLYHTAVIAGSLRDGLRERLGTPSELPSTALPQTLFARLADDRVTLSLDSSGEPLYKRGLKVGPSRAPIRESLAAAILMAAGYDCRHPLVDPMCGSGTFSLEAAMIAKQLAPGARRNFAFMGWPGFRDEQWAYLKGEAESGVQVLDRPLIAASDVDADACRQLTGTIADNGLSDAVRVAYRDFFHCEAGQYGGGPGLISINPPYGIRIGSARAAEDLFRRICRHLLNAFAGWEVALIAPGGSLLREVPFPVRQVPLLHGGLKLTLCLGTIP